MRGCRKDESFGDANDVCGIVLRYLVLSHLHPSTRVHNCRYCMTDSFKFDINVNTKMGLQGEIALAFAELMSDLWTTDRKHIAPRRCVCMTEREREKERERERGCVCM